MSEDRSFAGPPVELLLDDEQARTLFDLALENGHTNSGWDLTPEDKWVMDRGGRVGRYLLIDKLGEGGFGIVWHATQTEPFNREVALKLIKPGMDSKQVIARFEAERQTLALMDHPNIAGVLDAGTTPLARPFFVMELVRGMPITTYCDQHCLTISRRLELFLHVCHGVHHAHQKAILHRDLKPSNILVEDVDGTPVPKIIDFGVAKALAASSEDPTKSSFLFTKTGTIIGTPQYMSPEQAGSLADVDACSDIYSLGIILYELLTGQTPILVEDVRNLPVDKVLQKIREMEPARPSVLLRNSTNTEKIRVTAEKRQTEPRKLVQDLRGDVDWIILKAIEKERKRRYDSVAALAEDIQRHLQDEPVAARPPTRVYVIGKFIRRNKVTFVGGTFVAIALLIGAMAAAWGYVRERQALRRSIVAEATARKESEKSQQVAAFLGNIFKEISLRNNSTLTADALRDLLDSADERRRSELQINPETDMRVSFILAQAYCELDMLEVAERLYQNALDRLQQLGMGDTAEAAESLYWIVWIRLRQAESGQADSPVSDTGAEALLQRCLAIRRRIFPLNSEVLLRTEALQIAIIRSRGELAKAQLHLHALIDGPQSREIKASSGYGWLLREQALILLQKGEFAQSYAVLDQARKILGGAAKSQNQSYQVQTDVCQIECMIDLQAGDLENAESAANRELGLRQLWLGYEDPRVLIKIAEFNLRSQHFREAEVNLARSLEISQQFGWLDVQSKALHKLVQNQDALNPPEAPARLNNLVNLARVLLLQFDQSVQTAKRRDNLLDEAAQLLKDEKVLQGRNPEEIALFYAVRGGIAIRREDYVAAIRDLSSASRSEPDNYLHRFQIAVFSLILRDESRYLSECNFLVTKLGPDTSAENLLWICRAALLRPTKNRAMLNQVRDSLHMRMDHLDELGDDWVALLMGMVEYRVGNYADAANWLDEATRSTHPEISVQAQLVTAMNQHCLGLPDQRVFLDKARACFSERLSRFRGTDSVAPMRDYLAAKILMEETQNLIINSPVSAR